MRKPKLLLFFILSTSAARAQTRLGTVEVEGERPAPDAPRPVEEVPFVTVIDARAPTVRTANVAELVAGSAGVQVRSRGGLGTFSSVSLRGSDANEVAVFIDGVPLSRAASGVIDLSLIPADGLERVEIWRGAPPVELGSEAVGGVVHLITKKGGRDQLRGSVGGGSFGARALSAGFSQARPLRVSLDAAYRGATGDFSYYNYGGTLLEPSDDKLAVRRNNGFDQVNLDVSVGGTRFWRVGAHGFWKRQGTPGLGITGAESEHATLTTGRALFDAAWDRAGERVDLHFAAHALYERLGFVNPYGDKVGQFGPAVSDGESIAGGVSGRAIAPWGAHQLWTAVSEVRVEARRTSDLLRPSRAGRWVARAIGGVGVVDELRFARDRLALTPSLRLDGVAAQLARDGDGNPLPNQRTDDVFVSPRLGLRAELRPWLVVRGSAGRFVRFPSLLELFGDGAFVIGRPSLRAESAWGGDAGIAIAFSRAKWAVSVEGAFFGRHVEDAIAFVPAAFATTPLNVGDARILGVEARAALRLRFVEASIDYTFLDTVNLSDEAGAFGRPLPGRPAHQLFARLALFGGPFRVTYDLQFTDEQFRDPQARNPIPARVLHGLTAQFAKNWFSFSLEVRNLADLRVVDLPLGGVHGDRTVPYPLVDYFDYPLPGRAFYATVAITK